MKHKKAFMDGGFSIFFTLVMIVFMYVMFLVYVNDTAIRESCDKINMEYYKAQDSTFCVDNDGNAHYVKIDCKLVNPFEYDCNLRIVSIGDIRTK